MLHQFADLNWLAILAGGIAYFALGALWYSPLLFIKAWIKLSGINMDDPNNKKGVMGIMAGSLLFMIITCIGLGLLRTGMEINGWQASLHIGLVLGIFISVPAVAIIYLYNRKPLALYFIDGGYHVVGITLASMVMHWIG